MSQKTSWGHMFYTFGYCWLNVKWFYASFVRSCGLFFPIVLGGECSTLRTARRWIHQHRPSVFPRAHLYSLVYVYVLSSPALNYNKMSVSFFFLVVVVVVFFFFFVHSLVISCQCKADGQAFSLFFLTCLCEWTRE